MILLRMANLLEAAPRFELGYKGFADPCLTTWLRRLAIGEANSIRTVVDSAIVWFAHVVST